MILVPRAQIPAKETLTEKQDSELVRNSCQKTGQSVISDANAIPVAGIGFLVRPGTPANSMELRCR
jgi:hypothetical protein